jgi:thiamine-phosphate pyrophosphorylase
MRSRSGALALASLPRLYAILDAGRFPDASTLLSVADELVAGGVTLLQYRNKLGSAREMTEHARSLKQRIGPRCRLIMNDRADLCLAAQFDGVHLGQEDLPADSVRAIVGNDLWLGLSTHSAAQIVEADKTSADYLAIGPVFPTFSKQKPDPVVGLDGVRQARALTKKPLVAIGGITRLNCREVIEAGADAVAVIADLMEEPRKSAEEFFRILR